MRTSEATDKLLPALLEAQSSSLGNIKKTAQNPHFRSSYVPLDVVIGSIREPLLSAGLLLSQDWTLDGDLVLMVTRITHVSGQWMESTSQARAQPVKGGVGPQQIGSCVTYMRRYALMGMFGIAETDDDGNTAQGTEEGRKEREHRQKVTTWVQRLEGRGWVERAEEYLEKPHHQWSAADLGKLRTEAARWKEEVDS